MRFLTYIFDIWTWVDRDDVAMLDAEIAADNTVDAGTSVIKIIVCKNYQDGVPSLLALDQDCVSPKEL